MIGCNGIRKGMGILKHFFYTAPWGVVRFWSFQRVWGFSNILAGLPVSIRPSKLLPTPSNSLATNELSRKHTCGIQFAPYYCETFKKDFS